MLKTTLNNQNQGQRNTSAVASGITRGPIPTAAQTSPARRVRRSSQRKLATASNTSLDQSNTANREEINNELLDMQLKSNDVTTIVSALKVLAKRHNGLTKPHKVNEFRDNILALIYKVLQNDNDEQIYELYRGLPNTEREILITRFLPIATLTYDVIRKEAGDQDGNQININNLKVFDTQVNEIDPRPEGWKLMHALVSHDFTEFKHRVSGLQILNMNVHYNQAGQFIYPTEKNVANSVQRFREEFDKAAETESQLKFDETLDRTKELYINIEKYKAAESTDTDQRQAVCELIIDNLRDIGVDLKTAEILSKLDGRTEQRTALTSAMLTLVRDDDTITVNNAARMYLVAELKAIKFSAEKLNEASFIHCRHYVEQALLKGENITSDEISKLASNHEGYSVDAKQELKDLKALYDAEKPAREKFNDSTIGKSIKELVSVLESFNGTTQHNSSINYIIDNILSLTDQPIDRLIDEINTLRKKQSNNDGDDELELSVDAQKELAKEVIKKLSKSLGSKVDEVKAITNIAIACFSMTTKDLVEFDSSTCIANLNEGQTLLGSKTLPETVKTIINSDPVISNMFNKADGNNDMPSPTTNDTSSNGVATTNSIATAVGLQTSHTTGDLRQQNQLANLPPANSVPSQSIVTGSANGKQTKAEACYDLAAETRILLISSTDIDEIIGHISTLYSLGESFEADQEQINKKIEKVTAEGTPEQILSLCSAFGNTLILCDELGNGGLLNIINNDLESRVIYNSQKLTAIHQLLNLIQKLVNRENNELNDDNQQLKELHGIYKALGYDSIPRPFTMQFGKIRKVNTALHYMLENDGITSDTFKRNLNIIGRKVQKDSSLSAKNLANEFPYFQNFQKAESQTLSTESVSSSARMLDSLQSEQNTNNSAKPTRQRASSLPTRQPRMNNVVPSPAAPATAQQHSPAPSTPVAPTHRGATPPLSRENHSNDAATTNSTDVHADAHSDAGDISGAAPTYGRESATLSASTPTTTAPIAAETDIILSEREQKELYRFLLGHFQGSNCQQIIETEVINPLKAKRDELNNEETKRDTKIAVFNAALRAVDNERENGLKEYVQKNTDKVRELKSKIPEADQQLSPKQEVIRDMAVSATAETVFPAIAKKLRSIRSEKSEIINAKAPEAHKKAADIIGHIIGGLFAALSLFTARRSNDFDRLFFGTNSARVLSNSKNNLLSKLPSVENQYRELGNKKIEMEINEMKADTPTPAA